MNYQIFFTPKEFEQANKKLLDEGLDEMVEGELYPSPTWGVPPFVPRIIQTMN